MSFNPTSPVTGTSVGSLVNPTYTLTEDKAPGNNGKQYAVTALGGTQSGVDVHSVSKPFTVTFFRPPVLRTLPQANPVTGVIKDIPSNTYKMVVRKGAQPAANQSPRNLVFTGSWEVPAGVETYEPEELDAFVAFTVATIQQQLAGIVASLKTAII